MPKKFKNVYVDSVQLCLKDDEGNTLKNEDGTTKLFRFKNDFNIAVKKDYSNDFSYIVEKFELGDLEEVSDA